MSIIDVLSRLALWLLLIDEADNRDGMPVGYRRRYALILYRVIVVGLLIYLIVRISGYGS
ncbi:hypothetical protein M2401_001732 [Pseudomonas sp. JUb42]|jgi:hypothetical protein|uniref:hypothetical protein n=1 Tax=Pseudomonas sp. JUb42 TaxID=2940611 RepID=UPI002167387E|nr:hypothetical protein [Pseudomonas sp. JUb42]MCS3468007.1 hypothetical protein [Pseudomonas sp. JUb42]